MTYGSNSGRRQSIAMMPEFTQSEYWGKNEITGKQATISAVKPFPLYIMCWVRESYPTEACVEKSQTVHDVPPANNAAVSGEQLLRYRRVKQCAPLARE